MTEMRLKHAYQGNVLQKKKMFTLDILMTKTGHPCLGQLKTRIVM